MQNLTIQIVHYNTPELLDKCLQSIFDQQTRHSFAVRVLDNSPHDELGPLREAWEGRVWFTQAHTNLGFGKGHNALFFGQEQNSMYTLLFNPSSRFHTPHDLERLVSFMETAPMCGAVGPQQVGASGKRGIDHGELHGWRAWLLGLASYRLSKTYTRSARVAWVSGASLLIRSALFRSLDGFDKDFFLYREEEDLLQRLRQQRWEVWYVPTVTVTHIEHASGSTYKKHMAASHRLFCKKHMSPYNPIPRIFEFVMVRVLRLWER